MVNFTVQPAVPLCAGQYEHIQNNPDRGFRLSLAMQAGTGLATLQPDRYNAIEALHREVQDYCLDNPRLIQVYFYLSDYWDRDLDETAFANMNAYFAELEKLGLKAVLRFAYLDTVDGFECKPHLSDKEPSPTQMVRHIKQLKPFLHTWADRVHALQAGLIGSWGECDLFTRDRINRDENRVEGITGETAILMAWLEAIPEHMHLQLRYMDMLTHNIPVSHSRYNEIGFHDDFVMDVPHVWNTAGGVPGSLAWQTLTKQTLTALMDGECILGPSNKVFHDGKTMDAILLAKRLCEHHFTSFSLVHNYREEGGSFSMEAWKQDYVNKECLVQAGLPFAPSWFQNEAGTPVKRSMFDYIQQYLGYYLELQSIYCNCQNDSIFFNATIQNYGFAPPLGLCGCELALLDEAGTCLAREPVCAPGVFLPGQLSRVDKFVALPPETHSVALVLANSAGEVAFFANDLPRQGRYQIIARRQP